VTEVENKPVRPLRRSRGRLHTDVQPIILKFKKRKKESDKGTDGDGKEKYSKGLEDIQVLEGNLMRIAQRSSKAVSRGIDTYEQERKKSSRAKKDGAIEDFVYNSGKATSAFLKETSELPLDLAEAVNTKSYRKRLRRSLRRTSRAMRIWRL
jgi:hypothetical protein